MLVTVALGFDLPHIFPPNAHPLGHPTAESQSRHPVPSSATPVLGQDLGPPLALGTIPPLGPLLALLGIRVPLVLHFDHIPDIAPIDRSRTDRHLANRRFLPPLGFREFPYFGFLPLPF